MNKQFYDPDKAILHNRYFHLLCIFFTVLYITARIFSAKTIPVHSILFTADNLIMPTLYVLQAISISIYGLKKTVNLILLAIVAQVIFSLFSLLAMILPSPQFWTLQQYYELIFGKQVYVALLSSLSFICASIVNLSFWNTINPNLVVLTIRRYTIIIVSIFMQSLIFSIFSFVDMLTIGILFKVFIGNCFIATVVLMISHKIFLRIYFFLIQNELSITHVGHVV